MLDLAGDPAIERRGIERFDARDAVPALRQRLPGLLSRVADCGQQADSGDYYSAGNNRLLTGATCLISIAALPVSPGARGGIGRWLFFL
jgi:hypothetical protein